MGAPGISGGVSRAEVGLDYLAVIDHVARRALGDQLAVVEHHETVRNRQHHLHDVLDHNDGDALLGDLADDGQRIVHFGLVETGVDLVEHQETRPHGEAFGKFQALATRQGQRRRRLIGHVGQAGKGQMLARNALRLAHVAGVPAEQRPRGDVVLHGHLWKRLNDLKRAGQALPCNLVWLRARDVLAFEVDAACRGRVDASDEIDERGLARTIRTDQADTLALLDREADAIDGIQAAEPPRDIVERQQRGHRTTLRGHQLAAIARMPFGMNRISATMMRPSAAAWMVRKLRDTNSSKASRITAPRGGPKIVPRPPSSTMTIGLTASSTSNTSGGSIYFTHEA